MSNTPQDSSPSRASDDRHRSDIDVAKGIGILAVVIGHVFTGPIVPAIFLWHMPLFFFISGYLLSPRQNVTRYLVSKAKSLLIPYASFLLLLSLPFLLKTALSDHRGFWLLVSNMLYGGSRLTSWFGVFWFVTCLFFTQQFANLLVTRAIKISVFICAASLLMAFFLARFFPETETPWNLHIVFMALPIFMFGYLIRAGFMRDYVRWVAVFTPIALVLAATGILGTFDMKRGWYGTPFISLIAAVSIIIFIFKTAKIITHCEKLSRSLEFFGRASMTVMFTHQAVQVSLLALGFNSSILRVLIALSMGLIAHALLSKTELTRRLFLGRFEDSRTTRLVSA